MNETTLIQSKNILFSNINNLIQQQQIQQLHQHFIQKQLLKQEFSSSKSYQLISPANSPKSMEFQQSPNNSINRLDQQASPLNRSNSSTMELSIENQNMQLYNTSSSCENSLVISPISTPTSSPINCVSPISTTSSSISIHLPMQSFNNQTTKTTNSTLMPVEYHHQINQFINQNQIKSSKINLINKAIINQNVMLVDGQLPKKRKRKSNEKNVIANKRITKNGKQQQQQYFSEFMSNDKMRLNLDDESSCSSNSMNSDSYTSSSSKLTESKLTNETRVIEKINKKAKQRSAANERERKRMLSINQAFNRLREKVLTDQNTKLSKMDILKLAQVYITKLTTQLNIS